MENKWIALAVSVGLVAFSAKVSTDAGPSKSYTLPFISPAYLENTVEVRQNGIRIGAGFHVGDGLILTAKHVIEAEGPYSVTFRCHDSEDIYTIQATVLLVSNDADLGSLVVEMPKELKNRKGFKLADAEPVWGAPIVIVGCPGSLNLFPTSGYYVGLSQVLGYDGAQTIRLVSCQAYFGNSGGPVIDPMSDKVVGVLVAGNQAYNQSSLIVAIGYLGKFYLECKETLRSRDGK